jgi:tRNA pseudouridine38-40 synthase
MRVKLVLRYDGTNFAGWQKQSESAADRRPTLQATMEGALGTIFQQPVKVTASGRTDAGVHAEAQVVHFDSPKDLAHINIVRALNALTPDDIAVQKAYVAPDDFHALFSATGKTYRYLIFNHPVPDPLRSRYATWFAKPLDLSRLNALTAVLVGEHDFKSFQTSGTKVKTTVRQVSEARWFAVDSTPHLIEFRISGTGFLKQMVRNIVGTTLYLHQNGGTPADMRQILQDRDRTKAKGTAAPQGLHLHAVYYPPELDNKCREL